MRNPTTPSHQSRTLREQIVDGGLEHELECASPRRSGSAVAGEAEAGPLVELSRRLVRLLHEQHDLRRAALPGPGCDGADQVLRDPAPAGAAIYPHRDQLHLQWVDTRECTDDTEPAAALLGHEEGLLVAGGGFTQPVAPLLVWLADEVVVADREEVGIVPQHPQA